MMTMQELLKDVRLKMLGHLNTTYENFFRYLLSNDADGIKSCRIKIKNLLEEIAFVEDLLLKEQIP